MSVWSLSGCVVKSHGRFSHYLSVTSLSFISPAGAFLCRPYGITGAVCMSTGGIQATNSDWRKGLRKISEMPGPKCYPVFGTLKFSGQDLAEVIPEFTKRAIAFYPIYKERMLGQDIVILVGAEQVEKFLRKESKYPNRFEIPLWMDYRQKSGEEHGVFTGRDVHWHQMRSIVDKPLLRMKNITSYAVDMNLVISDFLTRIDKIRDENQLVPDLETELFNWSLESIGSILYERRFGGLSDKRDPEMEEFIKAVGVMLQHSTDLFIFPIWFIRLFKSKEYKEHYDAWDTIFRTARKCVDEKMEKIRAAEEQGEDSHGVLSYLLAQKSMPIKEVYSNISEIMMAAVDTTSNTTLFFLYEVARNPEVQEKLLSEIDMILPDGKIPTYSDIHHLPYLRAAVKETLRLYPVANSISRILDEDMELGGYYIPKKTAISIPLYALSRMTQHFEDPYEFRPERWLKDRKDRPNPFSSLPFGYGTRMCVGRRVAELELHLLLSRLLQRYRVDPAFTKPYKIHMKLVLRPDRPLKVKLINRETGK